MNKIYPNTDKLLKRHKELKASISRLYEEKDKLSKVISLLEKEIMIVEQMLKLSSAINNELVNTTDGNIARKDD